MSLKNVIFLVSFFLFNFSMVAQNDPYGLDGKEFVLTNLANNKVLDAEAGGLGKNGTKVQSYYKGGNGMPNQTWKFVATGEGENLFYIVNQDPKSGAFNYLEVSSHSIGKENGTVQLWEFNGGSKGTYGPNQVWKVHQQGSGAFSIVSHSNGAYALSFNKNQINQDGGAAVICYNSGGLKHMYWNFTEVGSSTKSTLTAGQTLKIGEKLVSKNGAYMLVMQEDGNLCVYKNNNGQQGEFKWGSMQYGFTNAKLTMQTDGNLVVTDGSGEARWSSETHPHFNQKFASASNKPVKLVLSDQGVLELYTSNNSKIWSSN